MAKIDGPKGYDPEGSGATKGDSFEDDPVGSAFDDSAAGTGTVSRVADDAEGDTGTAGVFKDAGGAEVEDSYVDEFSGLAAGADAGTRTGFSDDGG